MIDQELSQDVDPDESRIRLGDVMWIKCDIDGCGKKWRLAVVRKLDFSEEGPMVYFPIEDYEDYPDGYENDEIVWVESPSSEAMAEAYAAVKHDLDSRAPWIALWEAINEYARTCGGNIAHPGYNEPRMHAVVAVEDAVKGLMKEVRSRANGAPPDNAREV